MSETCKDGISNLPDSLIYHIHSFLEIKDGARTSVLSKRWNYIWTTVPTLDFQMRYDFIPNSLKTQKFMNFVDGTLHRHSSNVDKFAVSWPQPLDESRLHSWISKVIRGNVKELSLNLSQDHPLLTPLSLFTCKSLISLELGFRHSPSITLPKYISFPRLKRLKLKGFDFDDEYWNEELFLNSPVLEELTLQYCKFRMRNFSILIPTLKLLQIDTGFCCREEEDLRDCVFKINAPELVTFSYRGYVAKEFALSSFQALVEASVYFNTEDHVSAEAICQFLGALAHVKCLAVCDKTLQAICSTNDMSNNLLTFHNVKRLSISDVLNTDQGLIAMLKAVPNLESLVFEYYMNDEVVDDSDEEDEIDSDEDVSHSAEGDGDGGSVEGVNNHKNEDEGDVADAADCRSNDKCEDNNSSENESLALDIGTTGCLFPHLKSVCFEEFAGNPREMKWVRLILRDAKYLQTMTITYCEDYYGSFVNARSEKEVMVEIPRFPRASTACVIKICSED